MTKSEIILKIAKEQGWKVKRFKMSKLKLEDLRGIPLPKVVNFKVGDRVRILDYLASLKHRKNKNGTITNINGGYILVRPMWCKWEVELYRNEIEKL